MARKGFVESVQPSEPEEEVDELVDTEELFGDLDATEA